MTGIFREVFLSYSPNPGATATRSAYRRFRSSPSASCARTSNVSMPFFAPTSTLATGFALRLWYHPGWSGAPPFDATTTYRSPSRPHGGEQHQLVPEWPHPFPAFGVELLDGRRVPVCHRNLLTFL